MLGRQKTSKKGAGLPIDWQESLSRLLNDTYSRECKANDRYFDVYGQIYPDELLLIVSYLSEKDEGMAPIALFLTCDPDHLKSEEKVRSTQKDYVELTGLFFDEVFANSEWSEFEPTWQQVTHNHHSYHYKLSRENINLTLKANLLLGEDFEDVEFDTDPEQ